MARAQLRDALAPLPATHVVSPDGLLKDISYGAGISGGIVEFVPGKGPRISQEARDRGWVLLGEMYKQEGRSADHEKYLHFRELAASGQVNPDSFPESKLPKGLLERREKAKRKPGELPGFDFDSGKPAEEPKPAASTDAKPKVK